MGTVRPKGEQASGSIDYLWLATLSLFVRRERVLIYIQPLAHELYLAVVMPWIELYVRTDIK